MTASVALGAELPGQGDQQVVLAPVDERVELEDRGLRLGAEVVEPDPQESRSGRWCRAEHLHVGLVDALAFVGLGTVDRRTQPDEVAVRVEYDDRQVGVDEQLFEEHAERVGLPRSRLPAQEGVPVERGTRQHRRPGLRDADAHPRCPAALERSPHLVWCLLDPPPVEGVHQRCVELPVAPEHAEDATLADGRVRRTTLAQDLAEHAVPRLRVQDHQVTGDRRTVHVVDLEGAAVQRADRAPALPLALLHRDLTPRAATGPRPWKVERGTTRCGSPDTGETRGSGVGPESQGCEQNRPAAPSG